MESDEESYTSSMELDDLPGESDSNEGNPRCLGPIPISVCDTEIVELESKCKEGKALLGGLTDILKRHSIGNVWREQAKKIAEIGESTPRVIIGLIGSTGAGKSSVINALLDEEQLVPTSCMRASTASITELSYNHGPGKYAAEIEFISSDTWAKELQTLFEDIADGVNSDFYDPPASDDSDFAIAYAKCNAVYGLKLRDLSSKTVDDLMSDKGVSELLGTTVRFSENEVSSFFERLQRFVDSTENNRQETHQMALWPLIKLVRLKTKASVLSTGAVLVDLPGLLDTNSARGSVARSYIQKCSALWIVAPVTRAVDDGTARSLLGDTFKRQMQLDGGFDYITFVCSKCDEINVLEASQALGMSELDAVKEFREYAQAALSKNQTRIQYLGDQKIGISSEIKQLDLDARQFDATIGHSAKPGKRRISDYFAVTKKPKMENPNKDFDFAVGSKAQAHQHLSLSAFDEGIKVRLEEQKLRKKELYKQRKVINQELKSLHAYAKDLKTQREEKETQFKRNCILLRNLYSKGRIQEDFKSGIRALDESDGKEAHRDYDKIGRALPVFCVSSRAYQKLQGRFSMESPAKAFETIDDTEIPQLQAHCVQATVLARKMGCMEFLNELHQLINTLSLQARSTESALIGGSKEEDKLLLEAHLEALNKSLITTYKDFSVKYSTEMNENIFTKLGSSAEVASSKAKDTVSLWNASSKPNAVAWNTYKAICRRSGTYKNKSRRFDWNDDLIQPMMPVIASSWEQSFTQNIPRLLDAFVADSTRAVGTFCGDVTGSLPSISTNDLLSRMLRAQTLQYQTALELMVSNLKNEIEITQKGVNRTILFNITRFLKVAYASATECKGPGCLEAMKAVMSRRIDETHNQIFRYSANEVKKSLLEMIIANEETIQSKIEQVFSAISKDFGSCLDESRLASADERALKTEMVTFLQDITLFPGLNAGGSELPLKSERFDTSIKVKTEAPEF